MPSLANPVSSVSAGSGPQVSGVGGGANVSVALLAHITDPTDAHAATAIGFGGSNTWADGTTNPAANTEVQLDKIVTDLATGDGAGKISYNGGVAWADGTTNPATTVGGQLDKVLTDLSASTGSAKIGGAAIVQTSFTISSGTIRDQLVALSESNQIQYDYQVDWADGTNFPTDTVQGALDRIPQTLASVTGPNGGTRKIGGEAIVNTSATITAGTLLSQLTLLSRAANLQYNPGPAWLGGRTNPAATVQAQLDKIINDLGATTASDDGAERVGAATQAGSPDSLVSTSVRAQINDLLTLANARSRIAGDETISGNWTHSGTSTHNALVTLNGGVTIDEDDNPAWDATRTITIPVIRRFISQDTNQDASTWWDYDVNGQPEQVASSSATVIFPVYMIPQGVTITQVRMYIDPQAGHGALPGGMPAITLYSYSAGTTRVTEGSQTDTSASVGAYEATHAVTLSGLSVDTTNKGFEIAVQGEFGSDWVTGLRVRYIDITYTTNVVNLSLAPT